MDDLSTLLHKTFNNEMNIDFFTRSQTSIDSHGK
jgi:hypothetical protein